MKFSALLVALAPMMAAAISSSVLSKARRLDDGDEQEDEEVDYEELMQNLYKYDAKFIGCRNVHKYSEEFDTGFENEIQVIFRLCSSSNCASDQCNVDGEYGQYILGVEDYMDAHEEWKENYKGMYCANELYEAAVAEESGTEYTYSDYCCEYNENCEQEEEENDFDVEKYIEGCNQVKGDNEIYDEDGVEIEEVYMGVTCKNGHSITLDMFADENCQVTVEEKYSRTAASLWYSMFGANNDVIGENLVEEACISCKVMDNLEEAANGDGEENDEDEDNVMEFCKDIYEPAAKCEDNWFNSFDQACTYMESVKINFGDVDETEYSSGGSGVTATAGVFTATTVGLAAYVYYLKGKVDSSQINLGN